MVKSRGKDKMQRKRKSLVEPTGDLVTPCGVSNLLSVLCSLQLFKEVSWIK